MLPVTATLLNALPHFLWPNKPNYNLGNLYAHHIGGMNSEADTTPGVSFSPTIHATDQGKVIGMFPVTAPLLNAVPHFLWPNKPNYNLGNLYAHEIGGMTSEEDTTTGVSFSPTSEAYHMKKWLGVLVVAPLVWLT